MINFEYKSGILEGADASGREWCWFKGDTEIVISHDGENIGTLTTHANATVTEVKAIIRTDAKRAR